MDYKHTYYIKDLVYGASDGLVTTFAVIAGVAGAGLSIGTVLIVGYASLFADAFSMAAANYLGTKSECAVIQNGGGRCERGHHWKAATFTFIAFIIAGQIPLLPYVLAGEGTDIFWYSVMATGLAFFLIGSARSILTKRNVFYSGLEMLIIGGIAALIAFYVGQGIEALVV